MKRALQAKRNYWFTELSQLVHNRQLLKTILGFINRILWVAAARHKYMDRLANGRVSIRRKFVEITRQRISTHISTMGMSGYMKRYWCGSDEKRKFGGCDRAWNSRPKLLEVQKLLEGWELFRVESPGLRPKDVNNKATIYREVKIAELLIIAEVVESLLMDTAYGSGKYTKKNNFATLPAHRGYFLVKCFNTLFLGIAQWRRQSEDDLILPIWELSPEEEAEWEYEFGWELAW